MDILSVMLDAEQDGAPTGYKFADGKVPVHSFGYCDNVIARDTKLAALKLPKRSFCRCKCS